MLDTKGMHFPSDVILVSIRWYAAYPLSYRRLDEMMAERGVLVNHSLINRFAIGFLPLLENMSCKSQFMVHGDDICRPLLCLCRKYPCGLTSWPSRWLNHIR